MNFKNILFGFLSQLRSLWIIFIKLFSKSETRLYPEEPVSLSNRYRGRIVLTHDSNGKERCVACNLCAVACPVSCISLQKGEKKKRWYPVFFRINFARCIFCGLCEEACPTLAIQLIPDVELSEYNRIDLIYEKNDLLISGVGKYPDYNFYKVSSVACKVKTKKNKKKTNLNIVNVKDLLL